MKGRQYGSHFTRDLFILHPSSFILPFNPPLVPERQIEERPEVEAVFACAAAVLFEETRDEAVVEQVSTA
jgi:hypothetical protein